MNPVVVFVLGACFGGFIGVLVSGLLVAASRQVPPAPGIPHHRLDAMDRATTLKQLVDAGRYGEAFRLVGITDAQADRMSQHELATAFEVRVQALLRKAGAE